MLNLSIYFLFQNIFLITLLFWLLSFIGAKFFKKKEYVSGPELFECGFFTTHDLNLSFNYSFFLTAVLLILYDLEFFFLLPFIFNMNVLTILTSFIFIIFFLLILVSFIFDWEMVILDWDI
jgi:NADH:ubiquinone oxidoreductase subunit 3 (subunit A)